jgi:hypothetical protein
MSFRSPVFRRLDVIATRRCLIQRLVPIGQWCPLSGNHQTRHPCPVSQEDGLNAPPRLSTTSPHRRLGPRLNIR